MRDWVDIIIEPIRPTYRTPEYNDSEDAGMDVFAANEEDILIASGDTKIIPLGFKLQIPPGYEIQVRPRSGNTVKTYLRVANSPGTVDCNYRGEVGVIMQNSSNPGYCSGFLSISGGLDYLKNSLIPLSEQRGGTYRICKGDKIAQFVLARVPGIKLIEGKVDAGSEARKGGFGSSDEKVSS